MKTYGYERSAKRDSSYSSAQKTFDNGAQAVPDEELTPEIPAVGDHPPAVSVIRDSLFKAEKLRQSHGKQKECADANACVEHVVAAISGNSDLDSEVCKMARKVSELTEAHIHFVSVITHMTEPAVYETLASVGGAAVSSDIDLCRLEDQRELRKKEFVELARRCDLPDIYSIEIRAGLIADEILAASNNWAASMIVVGSSGKSWLGRMLSLEVASELPKSASCPVMVVSSRLRTHSQ